MTVGKTREHNSLKLETPLRCFPPHYTTNLTESVRGHDGEASRVGDGSAASGRLLPRSVASPRRPSGRQWYVRVLVRLSLVRFSLISATGCNYVGVVLFAVHVAVFSPALLVVSES